jgi:hypothetical protein
MLLDALNFSNNSIVGLPREFINSCKIETIITGPAANGLITIVNDIPSKTSQTFHLVSRLKSILDIFMV